MPRVYGMGCFNPFVPVIPFQQPIPMMPVSMKPTMNGNGMNGGMMPAMQQLGMNGNGMNGGMMPAMQPQ
ncbi:9459_t:CDS:1, partial [Ambispora leptoticha]